MPTNPERVARKLIDALCIPPRRHQLDLFCPDAVWLFPLAVEPAPRQLYGKAEIEAAMGPRWDAADAAGLDIRPTEVRIRPLVERSTVLSESPWFSEVREAGSAPSLMSCAYATT